MELDLKIKMEIINDDHAYENWGLKDLRDSETYQFIVIAFGNGIIEEARIVGETKGGVFVFVNLIERGGYRRGKVSDIKNVKLYQDGDICYPESSPFIFVSPVTEDGERINFEDYRNDVEAFFKSLKSDKTAS